MEGNKHLQEIDAIAQYPPDVSCGKIQLTSKQISLDVLLKDFTVGDYKSAFFLLMDYIGLDTYFKLSQIEKPFLFKNFCNLCTRLYNVDDIVIELLSIMKKYKQLRWMDHCSCPCKNFQGINLTHIDAVWKMLYALCEELTDSDLETLKQKVPEMTRKQIETAEDWFCWALKNNKISKADFSQLKIIFNNYPKCLEIIEKFQVNLKSYYVRTPTAAVHCGIALIVNFETFDEESKLPNREGSIIDVSNLENLWKTFGFKTEILSNLTHLEIFKQFEHYALLDHSEYDLFICCILSHGDSNCIYSSDGVAILIPELIATITNKSSTLNHKPKLFFIQACQGSYIPHVGKTIKINTPGKHSIPSHSTGPPRACDTLRVVSSIDGFVSFRCVENGSWFVQALCKAMMQYGDKLSILDVITEVRNEVHKFSKPGGPLQIVDCSNTFYKTLFLKKIK